MAGFGTIGSGGGGGGGTTLTDSASLASAISDETGTGLLVMQTSPTLVTPVLGAATATTVNSAVITAGLSILQQQTFGGY
jgi:hypothetical protein